MAFGVPAGVLVLSVTGRHWASYSPLGISFFILKMGVCHLTCLLCRVKVQIRVVTKVFRTPSNLFCMGPAVPGGVLAAGGTSASNLPLPLCQESAEFLTSGE